MGQRFALENYSDKSKRILELWFPFVIWNYAQQIVDKFETWLQKQANIFAVDKVQNSAQSNGHTGSWLYSVIVYQS